MWPFSRKEKAVLEEVGDEPSILCATANILEEVEWGEQREKRSGTKHFRGGAKVYIIDSYPGMCESAIVIGHHRKSGRYIKLSLKVKYLGNFRVTSVYSPKVISLAEEHYRERGKASSWGGGVGVDPEHLCASVGEWARTERTRGGI